MLIKEEQHSSPKNEKIDGNQTECEQLTTDNILNLGRLQSEFKIKQAELQKRLDMSC